MAANIEGPEVPGNGPQIGLAQRLLLDQTPTLAPGAEPTRVWCSRSCV